MSEEKSYKNYVISRTTNEYVTVGCKYELVEHPEAGYFIVKTPHGGLKVVLDNHSFIFIFSDSGEISVDDVKIKTDYDNKQKRKEKPHGYVRGADYYKNLWRGGSRNKDE